MEQYTLVYEALLWDTSFMGKMDNYIKSAMKDGTININDIPQMVLLIVQLLKSKILNGNTKYKLTFDDTVQLLDIYKEYIIEKIIVEFDIDSFTKMYNNCVKLVTLTLQFTYSKSKDKGKGCF